MRKQFLQPGFTLIETMVALSILVIALVAPITIIVQTTQANNLANERIVAVFLAQEGLELAQQIRDQAALQYVEPLIDNDPNTNPSPSATPWYGTVNGVDYSACQGFCGLSRFDGGTNLLVQAYDGAAPLDCSSDISNCQLYLNSRSGRWFYSHESSGTPTIFTRTVSINDVVVGEEAEIVSTVTFQGQQVVMTTSVFNIYEE